MASYSCVSGFGMSGGDATRTCGGDGSSPSGVWSGVAPSCGGRSRMTLYIINFKLFYTQPSHALP